jgi:hypothetical protein
MTNCGPGGVPPTGREGNTMSAPLNAPDHSDDHA